MDVNTEQQSARCNMVSILDEIIKDDTCTYISTKALLTALSLRGQYILFVFALVLSLIFSYIISYSTNTLSIMDKICEISFDLSLGLFAMFFTGYTLFQALANRGTILTLLSSKAPNTKTTIKFNSTYEEYNTYFLGICYLSILLLGITFITRLFLAIVPEDFYIKSLSNCINSTLAFILIFLYLLLNFKVIIECKSFVLNIFKAIIMSHSNMLLE